MSAELILVLNAGSSSLKYRSYSKQEHSGLQMVAKGQIEEEKLAQWLEDLSKGNTIRAVGHRVVHGGQDFSSPIVINPQNLARLREFTHLAPLHQPHSLNGIDTVSRILPAVPQVACFDTSFHHGRGELAEMLPLPQQLCRENGLRRYGFHGISYEYIASVLPVAGKVIVAHLGNGASLCAMENGKCVDCTMSFTPLDGLCMGTRTGAIDPGAVLYLFQALKMTDLEVEEILYQKSGLKGISGISNDMRQLQNSKDPNAELAIQYFVRQISKEIGGLVALMGGLDAIIFTAGIGEHSPDVRYRICRSSQWLGLNLDETANLLTARLISTSSSTVSLWVIPTDEELMIARHTVKVLGLN